MTPHFIKPRTAPVLIFVHAARSLNGALIEQALQELVEAGFGIAVKLEEVLAGRRPGPLLVIDGDDRRAGAAALQEAGITPDFELVVTDLGLETGDDHPFEAGDLQLLKDGIQAVCTTSNGPTPQFNCPCCG